MNREIIKILTPEDAELAAKKAELETLSQLLAEKELEIEELKNSMSTFQHRYLSKISKRYIELDDIRAQIAELKAAQSPRDKALEEEATKARAQAKEAAEDYADDDSKSPIELLGAEESEEAKKLYRKTASIIHPDKSTDDKSRDIRTKMMAELNEAYAQKDVSRMQTILDQWNESPDAISGEGTAHDLVRTIRAIAKVKGRISMIEKKIAEIRSSEICMLMAKVHDGDLSGRDILTEMLNSIESEIHDAQNELTELKK